MEMNEVLAKLPKHLLSLVTEQPYDNYTHRDHAVWRYVMRQNLRYLPQVTHDSYQEGLAKTGITTEKIPHMYGMNRILKEIGWAAVAVDGFIPPSAFMEFQSYNVLVIAADIRPFDQIEYTPAPDIIHEAAGHAPIIADPEYAEYLRLFGEIGSKAFPSAHDKKLYEAIRHLSILKANPYTAPEKIAQAENRLRMLEQDKPEQPSELAMIRNLHWWTVEYGLIGSVDKPKIYGAGLLSSIGESYSALQPQVKKYPYTLNAVHYDFDITTRQPQLFVTPDFTHLTNVLKEFTERMALRKGGVEGLSKAIACGEPSTAVLSSGLQVSGVFSRVIEKEGKAAYYSLSGPAMLCYRDNPIEGHGVEYHRHGFGSPAGKIKGIGIPAEEMDDDTLESLRTEDGNILIPFESGVVVSGKLSGTLRRDNKLLLITLTECVVRYESEILFDPSWGVYDMAVGEAVRSVFHGPAHPDAYGYTYEAPAEKTHRIMHTPEDIKLFELYRQVRQVREEGIEKHRLESVFNLCRTVWPDDWLLPLELLEIATKENNQRLSKALREYLDALSTERPDYTMLITNGLSNLSS